MIKVVRQAFYNAFSKVLLLRFRIESLFFTRVRDEAQFKERRRHIGMQEDVEVAVLTPRSEKFVAFMFCRWM